MRRNGQVMLISVVTLSGILVSSAGIAGLLMIYQVRGANDAVASGKALFAADAGVEAASFCYFKGCDPDTPESKAEKIIFEDSSVSINLNSDLTTSTLVIISQGLAQNGKTIRILEAQFTP